MPSASRTLLQTPPLIPRAAPEEAPAIQSVSLSSTTVSAGQTVSGSVTTSSNVASVEARIAGYSMNAVKTGVGTFGLTYRVPSLPFFLRRTYTLQVIARNTAGRATERDLPLTIR